MQTAIKTFEEIKTWRNQNKKKQKQEEMKNPNGSPKYNQEFFKYNVKKFYFQSS